MRVMILYEHCSPHQVTVLESARQRFQTLGHSLIPVEFYYGSLDYGWTMGDKPRPAEWICLFPQAQSISNYQRFRAVCKLVKQHKIDVLVLNGWYGLFAWWLVLIKKWLGCRIVMVSDSVHWDFPRTIVKELPKKMLMKGVDAGFVAGAPQAEYLSSLGMPANRLTTGNDVVDNNLYAHIPIRSVPENRKVIIGTAARLIPKKNLAAALKALAQVAKQHPDVQVEWQLAGRGPLEKELQQLAQEVGAPVVFRGFVGYYDMPGFYAELDLYWQPSLSEPWGLVVNEAMASGLPVLVSDRCGCGPDLVTKETGWIHGLSQEDMVAGLTSALKARLHWPEMGEQARKLIGNWDEKRYAEGLLQACFLATGQRDGQMRFSS